MVVRAFVTVVLSWLLGTAVAAQTAAPTVQSAAVPRYVVGVSGVLIDDWETGARQIGEGLYEPGPGTVQTSNGGEVFVGRQMFTVNGMPVAFELPVAYVPRVAQAAIDPLFADMGLPQDAPYAAVYVVPRLTAVFPATGRWLFVASMGAGVGWFTGSDDERQTEVGFPLSMLVGGGVRLGNRWSVRVMAGGYTHTRDRDRSVVAATASLVRHFQVHARKPEGGG